VHGNGLASLDLDGGATLYLRRPAAAWLPAAARRDGWLIEYPAMGGLFPAAVRLRSEGGTVDVDLTATLSQIQTNHDLLAETFSVEIPATAAPLTLDELRDAGPLRGPQ
jgi:hypothetical protein